MYRFKIFSCVVCRPPFVFLPWAPHPHPPTHIPTGNGVPELPLLCLNHQQGDCNFCYLVQSLPLTFKASTDWGITVIPFDSVEHSKVNTACNSMGVV